jgi:hypothetical protein
MDMTQRRAAWSAGWGVLALLLGGGAVSTWMMALTPGSKFPAWPAWILTVSTVIALYASFAYLAGKWPTARDNDQTVRVDLIPEPVGDDLHLILVNRGPAAEFSAQVTAILAPMGQRTAPQNWTIPWLEDGSTEPKRIFAGARQVLDFARYNHDAVNAELNTGHDSAGHWLFPTAPAAIGKRYYNLRRQEDLNLQRFTLTVHIMNANSGKHLGLRLSVGIQDCNLVCEIGPIGASE